MNFNDLVLNESYSFSLIPSAIWPDKNNARFIGRVSYDVAAKLSNVHSQHASALAYLPAGTTTNPAKLRFLIFAIGDSQVALAEEWINVSTLRRVSNGTRTVVISNAAPQDDARIRSALAAAGFKVSSIA